MVKGDIEKIGSLYGKAESRFIEAIWSHGRKYDCEIRRSILHTLEEKFLDAGGDYLYRHLGRKNPIAKNVKIIKDCWGYRFDKRTLPKNLKPWIDCPYEAEWYMTDDDKAEVDKTGQARALVCYAVSEGTYEYPDERDLYLSLVRIH